METEKTMQDESPDSKDFVIRPEMLSSQVEFRGNEGLSEQQKNDIKKALITLHTLELMAQTIYKFQIGKEQSELNRRLAAAMCNEMTHYQDFQLKLYEYGFKPSILRVAYWIVGFVFGFGSKLLGEKAKLRTGIWVESKAVEHYSKLLDSAPWDDYTRGIIEKDQADEDEHIKQWKEMLSQL